MSRVLLPGQLTSVDDFDGNAILHVLEITSAELPNVAPQSIAVRGDRVRKLLAERRLSPGVNCMIFGRLQTSHSGKHLIAVDTDSGDEILVFPPSAA